MSDYLLLGSFRFQDFELPSGIGFGGRQRLAIHRMPGGGRVIDAMGRDDAAISWGGMFSGGDATQRARQLDQMRAAGAALSLSWEAFSYVVIIDDFQARYERSNWVPYQISCTVLADRSQRLASASGSMADQVAADLATAGAAFVVGEAQALLAVPGALSAGTTAYAAASSAIAMLQGQSEATIATNGQALLAATDPVAAASAAGQLAQATDASGYINRVAANVFGLG